MTEDQTIPIGPTEEHERSVEITPQALVVRAVFLKGGISGKSTVSATLTSTPAYAHTDSVREDLELLRGAPNPDLILQFHMDGDHAEVVAIGNPESEDWRLLHHDVEDVFHDQGGTTQAFADRVRDFIVEYLGKRPA